MADRSDYRTHVDSIVKRSLLASQMVDYEGELGVIIGRTAERVSAADAWRHVGGLVVVNDVSARDVQKSAAAAGLPGVGGAKTFPTFKPCSKFVTTPHDLDTEKLDFELTTRVNGEIRQRGTTSDLIFGVAEIIEAVTRRVMLQPGDLICTGTPGGIGMPQGKYLRAGDRVEISIDTLGSVCNDIVAGAS